MLEYENAKDIGHAAFCAAFTICPKSLEMPFIFSHFRPESINSLCDHSFFFALIMTEKRKSATMLQADS